MLITSLSITAELIGKNKTSSAFVYSSISLVDKIVNGKYFVSQRAVMNVYISFLSPSNFTIKFLSGVAVMVIQHYVPSKHGDEDDLKEFYGNVMVWVCGSFALIGMLSALSMIPMRIGTRRNLQTTKING